MAVRDLAYRWSAVFGKAVTVPFIWSGHAGRRGGCWLQALFSTQISSDVNLRKQTVKHRRDPSQARLWRCIDERWTDPACVSPQAAGIKVHESQGRTHRGNGGTVGRRSSGPGDLGAEIGCHWWQCSYRSSGAMICICWVKVSCNCATSTTLKGICCESGTCMAWALVSKTKKSRN